VEPEGYVDVNVFVYWLGGHPAFGESALEWVRRVESASRGKYVTSSLALYEVVVVLAGLTGRSLRDGGFVGEVLGAVTGLPGLLVVPFSLEDLVEGVELMGRYGLDFEDALHLAVALRVGARKIISNDGDFDGIPGVVRVF